VKSPIPGVKLTIQEVKSPIDGVKFPIFKTNRKLKVNSGLFHAFFGPEKA